jgi:hypothetical protein
VVWEAVQRTSEERGKWIAENTRHEGMTVDCSKRTVELKLFLQTRHSRTSPATGEIARTSGGTRTIAQTLGGRLQSHQWSVTLTVMSAKEETASFRADCH